VYLAVLPGRRVLKGVSRDFFENTAAAGPKLACGTSATKRRRAVKSGADEALDEERGGEEKDDDEEILTQIVHRLCFVGTSGSSTSNQRQHHDEREAMI